MEKQWPLLLRGKVIILLNISLFFTIGPGYFLIKQKIIPMK
jgi:hypothetical protein